MAETAETAEMVETAEIEWEVSSKSVLETTRDYWRLGDGQTYNVVPMDSTMLQSQGFI